MSRYQAHYVTHVNGEEVLVPELPEYLLENEADFVEDNETPVEAGTTWDGVVLQKGSQEAQWYLFYGLNFLRAPDPLAIPANTNVLIPHSGDIRARSEE